MNSYEALIIGRFFLGAFASVGTGAVECVVAVCEWLLKFETKPLHDLEFRCCTVLRR